MARITRRVFLSAAPLIPLAPYLTRSLFGEHLSTHTAQLYIGTYTHEMGPGNKGDGIYLAEWDAHAGTLRPLRLAMKTANPSFLAVSPRGDAFYAVNEDEDDPQPGGGKGGSVTAFRRDPSTGSLTQKNVQPSGGSDPCHITVDRANQAVFVANYSSGSLTSFRVTLAGVQGPIFEFSPHGHGPDAKRQERPHIHCVTLSPDERFLLVNDLGTDHIWIFHVDLKTAQLKETGAPWQAKPGSGPRHACFHPSGKWVYSINELTSTVDALAWNAKTGVLTSLAEVPLRDPAYKGETSGAELAIDRTGSFLYASNRAEDVLVVFKIDAASGALTFVQRIGCGGKTPRNFTLDPSEKWLVVANQDSQNVVVFARDPHDGTLKATDRSYHVGAPVGLLFA